MNAGRRAEAPGAPGDERRRADLARKRLGPAHLEPLVAKEVSPRMVTLVGRGNALQLGAGNIELAALGQLVNGLGESGAGCIVIDQLAPAIE